MNNPNYASPIELSEGTGLYDQCWARVKEAHTEITSKFKKATPVLSLTLTVDTEDHIELFMAGSTDNWSTDGKWFIPIKQFGGKDVKLSKNNAVGQLLDKINTAGFQWNLNTFGDQGCTQLVGHWFYIERYELTDRDGAELRNEKGFVKTAVMFTRWGGNGNQPNEAAGAPASSGATAAPAAASVGDAAKVEAAVVALLAGGQQTKQQILSGIAANPPIALQAAIELVGGVWATDPARPWNVIGSMFTKK